MKFTVIIPTRERSDTLYYTLRTCVTQDYNNLEILVSDNFSQDNTRDVVHSFEDKRIRYINTGKRVSMSRNWEFALDHVNEGYFTFVGDDDGLLPNAVENAKKILSLTNAKALTWLKVEYTWPSHPFLKNYLKVCLKNRLIMTPAKLIRRDVLLGLSAYNQAPCFYNSFVDVDIVKTIKMKTGNFFKSITPDIYSSLAAISVLDDFFYSTRAFSINGASHHSNGAATGTHNLNASTSKILERFFLENDLPIHEEMDVIPGLINSALAEAFMQANEACYENRLWISKHYWIFKIAKELASKPSETYQYGMARLKILCSRLKMKWLFYLCRKFIHNTPHKPIDNFYGFDSKDFLHVDAHLFDISNVYEASQFVARLLGDYSIPSEISRYSLMNSGFRFLIRAFSNTMTSHNIADYKCLTVNKW